MNSRGFEFSFGWLFAIIVGAAIIALAIYGTTTFVKTERKIEDSSKGVELSALLRQLETGLEESGMHLITAPVPTRISNECSLSGSTISEKTFGIQTLKTAVSSGIGKEWNNDAVPIKSQSIYLFSNKTVQGDSFTAFSRSFDYPYKVADIVILWPVGEKYCFVNALPSVEDTLESLKTPGVNFSSSIVRCPVGSKKVCFAQTGCDIDVSQTNGAVSKSGRTVYFDSIDSTLFYAAIFSDPLIYDCQVARLGKKASVLAGIYSEKSRFGSAYGCTSDNLFAALQTLKQLNNTRNSADLLAYKTSQEGLRRDNDALACPLF